MEENGVLTYTSEQRGFNFKTTAYVFNGNKCIETNGSARIDGGSIYKHGAEGVPQDWIGSYNVRVENGKVKVSINDVAQEEFEAVRADLWDLIEEVGLVPNAD